MPESNTSTSELDAIDQIAAMWVPRIAAGLAPKEEAELADWLAADPRRERALAEHQQAWERFAPLAEMSMAAEAPGPAASVVPSRNFVRFFLPVLAATAAIAIGFFVLRSPTAATASAARAVIVPLCEQRTLADGSVVELNRGAAIAVAFTAGQRRVQLLRGEAHFKVAKDAARPFVVITGGVEVRAVGTAFNVRFDPAAVEIVVTEGRVQVQTTAAAANPGAPGATALPEPSLVQAGQRAFVSLAPSAPPPVVTTVSPVEIEARLAWQPTLLDFDDVPLADIIADFNRRNPVRLVVDDPALASLRLTATFRSDNMSAFVRLMESNYGVRAEMRGPGEIVLRRVSATPEPR